MAMSNQTIEIDDQQRQHQHSHSFDYSTATQDGSHTTGTNPSHEGAATSAVSALTAASPTANNNGGDTNDGRVIMHRIASYLSLGDAESLASSRPSSSFVPGHYSLDYHYYHSIRNNRVSPLGIGSVGRNCHGGASSVDHHNNNIQRGLDSGNNGRDDEEDWFVGSHRSLSTRGGGGGQNDSVSNVNSVGAASCGTLLPLEEQVPGLVLEEDDENDEQPLEYTAWTPAGQPTSEADEKEYQLTAAKSSQNEQLEKYQRQGSDSSYSLRRKQRQKKRALQNKLAAAVFSHPHPLRTYCLDAYATALSLSVERQKRALSPREGHEVVVHKSIVREDGGFDIIQYKRDILHLLMARLLDNVPLSVLLDLIESTFDLSIETIYATTKLGTFTVHECISLLRETAIFVIDMLSRINPFHVFEFVLNAQRSAMGKTGDVLVSGIQSVATGVGSVSNAALNRLSRSGLALAGGVVAGSGSRSGLSRTGEMGSGGFGRGRKDGSVGDDILESKLFHRLQKMESVSKLVSYSERVGEEAFSRHAKKRAQRMMHYNVSFRPFTATIQPDGSPRNRKSRMKHNVSFELSSHLEGDGGGENDDDSVSSESINSSGSIFMRTPTSFPPTPTSRLYYFERGSQFTENVVFLARDQLRVERGVINHNEQTRAMSKALIDGSRLAVFDAANVGNGIALSCGQHIATKVGNALYCSTRSMIPVMRNSYVYFEISVSPNTSMSGPSSVPTPPVDATTLLIGLSTLEMPLDTLVGAWNGSVGLCSTGQILKSGQWFSMSNPGDSAYGSNSTVGCLVYIDDNSAYDTTEGPHVSVDATFNINGRIISPSVGIGDVEDNSERSGCEPTLSLIVPKAHELFPTVTLHSAGTSVMCRFNAEDLLANSRAEIGAQSGVVVYAVDGSVILDATDEDETFLDSSMHSNEFLHGEVSL